MTSPSPRAAGFTRLTGAGVAAVAVVRVFGGAAADFCLRHVVATRPREAWRVGDVLRARLVEADGPPLDDVLLSVHATPIESGDWDLHLHLHGSPWLGDRCAELLRAAGLTEQPDADAWATHARDAIDRALTATLPRMLTERGVDWLLGQARGLRAALQANLDLEDEPAARAALAPLLATPDRVAWFAEPLPIALLGPPNAGKSTLLNALVDREAAIVSSTPGTTRDWLDVLGELDGFPVRWLDTAGLRVATDPLEAAGIEQARLVLATAEARIVVLDASPHGDAARRAFAADLPELDPTLVVLNKCDLIGEPPAWVADELPAEWRRRVVRLSARTRAGIEQLGGRLFAGLGRTEAALQPIGPLTEGLRAAIAEALAAAEPAGRRQVIAAILQNAAPADF